MKIENLPPLPDTMRQSFLSQADGCLHSAYLSLDEPRHVTHAMTRGTLVHEFIQRATELMLLEGEVKLVPELAKTISQELIDECDENLTAFEADVVRQCAYTWAEGTEIDPATFVGVEVPLELRLDGMTVTGTLDRIDIVGNEAIIRDVKTSLYAPSVEEAASRPQLRTYATLLAYGALRGEEMALGRHVAGFHLVYEYPRLGLTEDGTMVSRHHYMDRGELLDHKASLQALVDRLRRAWETGNVPATTGSWCSICPARSRCPIPDASREFVYPESEEEARENLGQHLHLKAAADRARKSVKSWVEENGALLEGDMRADVTLQERRASIDPEKLQAAVAESLRDGTPFDVNEFFGKKSSSRFTIRRQRSDDPTD